MWVDIRAGGRSTRPVTLAELKADPAFATSPLVRQSRLSVVRLDDEQLAAIERRAGKPTRADTAGNGTRPTRRGTGRVAAVAGPSSWSGQGLQWNVPSPFDSGSVHSGPSFVLASWRLIIASGPAWCSPLNGVKPVNPQARRRPGC